MASRKSQRAASLSSEFERVVRRYSASWIANSKNRWTTSTRYTANTPPDPPAVSIEVRVAKDSSPFLRVFANRSIKDGTNLGAIGGMPYTNFQAFRDDRRYRDVFAPYSSGGGSVSSLEKAIYAVFYRYPESCGSLQNSTCAIIVASFSKDEDWKVASVGTFARDADVTTGRANAVVRNGNIIAQGDIANGAEILLAAGSHATLDEVHRIASGLDTRRRRNKRPGGEGEYSRPSSASTTRSQQTESSADGSADGSNAGQDTDENDDEGTAVDTEGPDVPQIERPIVTRETVVSASNTVNMALATDEFDFDTWVRNSNIQDDTLRRWASMVHKDYPEQLGEYSEETGMVPKTPAYKQIFTALLDGYVTYVNYLNALRKQMPPEEITEDMKDTIDALNTLTASLGRITTNQGTNQDLNNFTTDYAMRGTYRALENKLRRSGTTTPSEVLDSYMDPARQNALDSFQRRQRVVLDAQRAAAALLMDNDSDEEEEEDSDEEEGDSGQEEGDGEDGDGGGGGGEGQVPRYALFADLLQEVANAEGNDFDLRKQAVLVSNQVTNEELGNIRGCLRARKALEGRTQQLLNACGPTITRWPCQKTGNAQERHAVSVERLWLRLDKLQLANRLRP